MKYILLSFFLSLSILGCSDRNHQVLNHRWKYAYGYHIGDEIHFDATVFILGENGIIYKNGVLVARVINVKESSLIIESNDNQLGNYVIF